MNIQADEECTRNKGIRIQTGKILKGTLNQAPMKLRVSSIPSKHQKVVYHAPSRHAFGNSQTRFYQFKQQTPSPAQYNQNIRPQRIQSKKGYGPLVSQSPLRTLQTQTNYYPAPGSYNLALKSIISKKIKLLKSKSVSNKQNLWSQVRAHDLFKFEMKESSKMPGPTDYEIQSSLNKLKRAASTSNVPFKSKIDRFYEKDNQNPAVGNYQLNNPMNSTKTTKFSFNQQKVVQNQKLKYVEKIIGETPQQKVTIGPGTYQPKHIQSQKTFKIRQGMYDRFGNLKTIYRLVQQQQKSTYQYQQRNYKTISDFNTTKNSGFTSKFKSKTKRMKFEQPLMDPCIYNPKIISKQSHLINFTKKWV